MSDFDPATVQRACDSVPDTKEAILEWCGDGLGNIHSRLQSAHEFVYWLASSVEDPDSVWNARDPYATVHYLRDALRIEWQHRRLEEIHGDALTSDHDFVPELRDRVCAVLRGEGFGEWFARAVAGLRESIPPSQAREQNADALRIGVPRQGINSWLVRCTEGPPNGSYVYRDGFATKAEALECAAGASRRDEQTGREARAGKRTFTVEPVGT